MHISEVIRNRRRGLGLTQEQVAQRLGVSAPAVNKWERGMSYPDITLVPALARLLETDANTLLSFEPELSQEANLEIQREVDRLVREDGYEAGFAYAQERMRLYPASDELAIVLTQYLDGALTLFQVEEPDRYRPTLDKAYERLSQARCPKPESRRAACLSPALCRKSAMRMRNACSTPFISRRLTRRSARRFFLCAKAMMRRRRVRGRRA